MTIPMTVYYSANSSFRDELYINLYGSTPFEGTTHEGKTRGFTSVEGFYPDGENTPPKEAAQKTKQVADAFQHYLQDTTTRIVPPNPMDCYDIASTPVAKTLPNGVFKIEV